MYIKSLKASNFRCFREVEVELAYPASPPASPRRELPNVNLLLGDNGAGKTTVLKGLALAVLAPVIQDSGYKPYYLVRRTKAKPTRKPALVTCELILHRQDEGASALAEEAAETLSSAEVEIRGSYERITSRFVGRGGKERIGTALLPFEHERMFDDESPAFFLVGYGATRRVEQVEYLDAQARKRRGLRYRRVAGLFEEYMTLFPLAAWLPKLRSSSKARYEEVEALLADLLPDDTRLTGRFQDSELIFHHRGAELPFGALSDGYRAYVGLLGDLLYHLHLSCPKGSKLTEMTGVVLVDDIDLHLHPSWQRTVVPDLARTFAHLQFVLTSHSPIVAGTLHRQNVRIVEAAGVKQLKERVHGLSADQILTSSYFNLATSRAPDAEKQLARLSEEVAQRGDPAKAIAFLQELAGKKNGADDK